MSHKMSLQMQPISASIIKYQLHRKTMPIKIPHPTMNW
jgi:hypothetical protein